MFWLIFLFPGVVCILANNKFTCTTVSFGVVSSLCYSFAYKVEGWVWLGILCLAIIFTIPQTKTQI